ncbi:MAG TPA: type I methionyl aminopeptidase [Bacteroidota bacterium]|nr:type I methionyl aminopeptidase [Bacteroidota bacterium]
MRLKKSTQSIGNTLIKSPEEISFMRESCKIVAEVLRLLKTIIKPGIMTNELDQIAEEFIRSQNAEPAFKGYKAENQNPYPASICTSIDDQIVHGIPSNRKLREGEIIAIDVGVKKNQLYGDGAWTFPVGLISEGKRRLMRTAEESLFKGIECARAGKHVHDISAAIQTYVENDGYSVVRELVGHGVGRALHEEPAVPNFGTPGTGPSLRAGMTIAIEPMVNAGAHQVVVDSDGWTIRTADGSTSAHFEHTVLITEHGPEILTT